jgi:hypothetical protein
MKALKSNVPNLAERKLCAEPESLQKYSDEVREQITKKAYELYEQRNRRDGQDMADWLTAEEIVVRELHEGRR